VRLEEDSLGVSVQHLPSGLDELGIKIVPQNPLWGKGWEFLVRK